MQEQMGGKRGILSRVKGRWESCQEWGRQIEGRITGTKGEEGIWGFEDTREDVEILLSESDTESTRDELKEE